MAILNIYCGFELHGLSAGLAFCDNLAQKKRTEDDKIQFQIGSDIWTSEVGQILFVFCSDCRLQDRRVSVHCDSRRHEILNLDTFGCCFRFVVVCELNR